MKNMIVITFEEAKLITDCLEDYKDLVAKSAGDDEEDLELVSRIELELTHLRHLINLKP